MIKNDILDYYSMQGNSEIAEGTVNSLKKDNYGKYPTFSVEFKFTVATNSKIYLSKYRRSVKSGDFLVGSKFTIEYEKSRPENFFIVGRNPIKGAIVGIIILLITVITFLFFKNKIFKYYSEK